MRPTHTLATRCRHGRDVILSMDNVITHMGGDWEPCNLADMRAWCEDVFTDMPDDANDHEVIRAVAANYAGGLTGFDAGHGR